MKFVLLYCLFLLVLLYLAIYLPNQKRKKRDEEMQKNITVGDTVVSIGGILGTVIEADSDNIIIETGNDNCSITLIRSAIQSVVKKDNQINSDDK